jgi:inner membrane protein
MDWLYSAHVLWFLAGVGFLLAELALPGFVLLFFALGAFAAALCAYVGLNLGGQFLVFLAVSLAGVGLLRRMFLRVFQGRTHSPGGDAGPEDDSAGKTAVVTRAISPAVPGEIKFRGSFWRAESTEDIGEGENVVILGQTRHDTGAYTVRPAEREM